MPFFALRYRVDHLVNMDCVAPPKYPLKPQTASVPIALFVGLHARSQAFAKPLYPKGELQSPYLKTRCSCMESRVIGEIP